MILMVPISVEAEGQHRVELRMPDEVTTITFVNPDKDKVAAALAKMLVCLTHHPKAGG